jgi:3,2-trans-enoyl-CoA isomerase
LIPRAGSGMEAIKFEQQDGVALVKLNRGVINAINQKTIDELDEALRIVKHDPAVCGLVLASNNDKFFSIGFDLPEIYPLARQEFGTFFRSFNLLCLDLYTFPKPGVCAITGHATAGGCIVALCADYRYMAEGRALMGVNESTFGVPVTSLADGILGQLVGARHARDVISTGSLYGPQEALHMGMVDEVFPLEEVIPAAMTKARSLGEISPPAFAMDKGFRVRGLADRVLSHLEADEQAFVEHWYAPFVRRQLKQVMEQYTPRGKEDG